MVGEHKQIGRSAKAAGHSAEPEPEGGLGHSASVPNARRCGWCRKVERWQFYRGKRQMRCGCGDHRTPMEIRRDSVLNEYGDDPAAYTPAVLAQLAKDGLFDIAASFCPAGRLTLAEAKAREAKQIERDQ